MRTVIVGAGPSGLYAGIALARRGHAVTIVDRDPGPRDDQSWERKGVMQFHHPHGFRGQVIEALQAEMPEVIDALLEAGAVPITLPDRPDVMVGLRCRRMIFERVLRSAAIAQRGVELRQGHADEVCAAQGRAVAVVVDGERLDADLIIDASGRAGRLNQGLRAPAEGGDCGISYVSRQFELLPDADLGPMNTLLGMMATYSGYQVIVFLHDNRMFSTLIARASGDRELALLREPAAFEAACRAIPGLREWTSPERSRPFTPVLPGGRLYNSYQGQRDRNGRVALSGLIFLGDAICTTTPTAGRGIALSLMQARRLLELLDELAPDFTACSLAFEEWCDTYIKPWFTDHVSWDTDQARRWTGQDIDFAKPLTSDLICATAEVDPSMMAVVGPFFGMRTLPETLRPLEARAREIYATGWRPRLPDGPNRDELAALIHEATRSTQAEHPEGLRAR